MLHICRYHLDSDHSSQHDDKPEDIAQRILTLPGNVGKIKSGNLIIFIREYFKISRFNILNNLILALII